MVGANVKQETLTLMEKKAGIEAEMEAIITRLQPPAGPGLSGNLLDKDGFPRADIDIAAVRSDRQRVNVLQNDLKEVTKKIEQNLHVLHSGSLMRDSSLPQKRTAAGEESRPQRTTFSPSVAVAVGTSSSNGGDEPVNMEVEQATLYTPFAVFDEVTAGSPAEEDGIRLGDMLVKFGSVEGDTDLLQRLASEGQRNQGSPVEVVVLRNGVKLDLAITPRQWSGRGLLGCHIRPLAGRR
ncbi:26S proteasome regulatory subunit N4 [Marchantia polymorpha subsp. ruderalis]|uniref:Nas2 N-terminal domain-containing protein n=2 Tax=Marchantia polymorpha TaxID=3197 RepID=A0AAF6BY47_MARPO|nr:hypothetical protein MARPO_0003s0072 [Marchantia polymorpha]BBN16931.1 hypothetical protein Mp_7g10530 [Marchantia polymorpha subsp. ruderalis]|eukprot:PTQ49172.1 hypothetical protein MARPO_0003s0072 [Marchantia polymorpha]